MAASEKSGSLKAKGGVAAASVSIGTVIAATLGAACCSGPLLGPLIVAALGVSGAAALAGIKPYTPYLFLVSFLMLILSFWGLYRPSAPCVADEQDKARRTARRPVEILLWLAAAVWIVSVSFSFISLAKA